MTESNSLRPILDHIVILVSYQTLQQLPKRLESVLTVIDGGAHADGRTVNKLIEFSDGVYIELIAFQDGIDPERRKAHRWGELEENTLVDWAYTLPDEKDFGVIQQRVKDANSEIIYHDPVPGGRIRPDGVELKWSVASAYTASGKAVHPGKAPFWCLDRTPRHLRVPYKEDDGSEPSYTKHTSGAIGVSGVSISVPKEERHVIAGVYNGIHGSNTEQGTWPFVVHSGSRNGKQAITLEISQDQKRHIHLTLVGDKSSPESIEILPGLKFSFESWKFPQRT
ncbi:glyoxalase-like domain-containing protein [Fusarium redolens]|uniref:Glyoxalase-like domain-containing protein n=1 Tax=Fusarium redolens TaxID=48865 RepID=A0A9P9JW29_FUSRE|nr:glyoxalase-like domain-containing protein [Fusarium redolens]KAH7234675.1 glyoxalase-like domain-containing protein [Fusarium redolens]